eukprot:5016153-Pyramimonas_sp.AAC.1
MLQFLERGLLLLDCGGASVFTYRWNLIYVRISSLGAAAGSSMCTRGYAAIASGPPSVANALDAGEYPAPLGRVEGNAW